MHNRCRRLADSKRMLGMLRAVTVVGAATLAAPTWGATSSLGATWAAALGGGNVVATAGIIALGAGGGTCSSTGGGNGAQVAGAIALVGTDTLIAYPGGLGGACGTPTGGAGGAGTDPNADYRGGNGGLPFNGDNIAESGAGGGAATTVYKNATTQVAFAGGGGGAGGDAVAKDNTQVQGGVAGAGSGGASGNGSAGGNGFAYGAATGGNGGAGGVFPWSKGKDATNATCSSGPCGGPAGGGAGSFNSIAAGDGAATVTQAAGAGGGGGGASAGPGLTSPVFAAAGSWAAGSASVTYIAITAGGVNNATIGGSYTGTSFAADSGWTGLAWALDGSCAGCSLPAGLAIDSSTGAVSGSVTASAGGYTFDVVATGNPASGPLTSFQLKTRRSVTMSVSANPLPSLTKAFGAVSIGDGGVAVLTFTVSNPAGGGALTNVGFVDTLPSGLRVANAPSTGGTCSNAAAATIATPGGTTVTVTNLKVPAGAATCTVTLNVTNAAAQQNSSCAGNPSAFTNAASNVGVTNVTNAVQPACLVVLGTPAPAAAIPATSDPVLALMIALLGLLAGTTLRRNRKARA